MNFDSNIKNIYYLSNNLMKNHWLSDLKPIRLRCFCSVSLLSFCSKKFIASYTFRIPLNIDTPCSVKAKGIADTLRLFGNAVTKCDRIDTHSSEESRNMKSSGNRFKFLFTAWFNKMSRFYR